MNTTLFHQDSIPAASAGIVELSDEFLGQLAGGNIFGDAWNAIKAVGNGIKNAVQQGAVAVSNYFAGKARTLACKKLGVGCH